MVISYNSQLGLRFSENEVKADFIGLMKKYLEEDLKLTQKTLNTLIKYKNASEGYSDDFTQEDADYLKEELELEKGGENVLGYLKANAKIRNTIKIMVGDQSIISDEDSSYYFICSSVFKAAELIKINEKFTGRTFKDIEYGKYTYLIGKQTMIRFICVKGAIQGFYYNEKERKAFEFGSYTLDEGYFYQPEYAKEFTMIMQLIAFVELGDIEVKILDAGRNNGGKKNVDKVTNTSNNSVYVVDSSWNQIIIRTDGFAVRGHFRLQPCGPGHKDRELIWIDAFKKHGYKRRPSAEVVR